MSNILIDAPALVIDYATTADMADGQSLPPLIEDEVIWHVVRRDNGFTLWRQIRCQKFPHTVESAASRPVPVQQQTKLHRIGTKQINSH